MVIVLIEAAVQRDTVRVKEQVLRKKETGKCAKNKSHFKQIAFKVA